MRRAAALVENHDSPPVFLFNVPATWQTPAARQYYREELLRLGRFLVRLGGKAPSEDELAAVVLQYDRARAALRTAWPCWPARQLAEATVRYRSGQQPFGEVPAPQLVGEHNSVPLALIGGPLLPHDFALFDVLEQIGGKVVLDGTETGERTLPPPVPLEEVSSHPLESLADAYFQNIPDPFRRPDDLLYQWFGQRIAERGVRGVVLRRYVWCDQWHAQWQRLCEWSPVPVLEIDVADGEEAVPARTLQRLEAFVETLR
jgi:benzoyl-CoA reductase/2-hydroxyglutaryl-CoA dehydratase subunit BcrC/BadD/HgdB